MRAMLKEAAKEFALEITAANKETFGQVVDEKQPGFMAEIKNVLQLNKQEVTTEVKKELDERINPLAERIEMLESARIGAGGGP